MCPTGPDVRDGARGNIIRVDDAIGVGRRPARVAEVAGALTNVIKAIESADVPLELVEVVVPDFRRAGLPR